MEKFKVEKNPKMSEAEALEFAGSLADEFREGLADGSTIVSDGPWAETVKAIKECRKRNATALPCSAIERNADVIFWWGARFDILCQK